MLIDTHCHLDFDVFDKDRAQVFTRAKEAGVSKLISICVNLENFPQVEKVANSNDSAWCSAGLHPCYVNEHSISYDELLAVVQKPKVVALGETGLDYFHDKGASKDVQQQHFRTHIAVARKVDKPIIVHTRDAEADTLALLQDEYKQAPFKGLIHCFTASQQFADAVLKLGMYISFSGIVTFKNAKELQAVAKTIPLNRLLVETDAPYLAPVPHRGKRNEPAFTRHTAEFLAELRGKSFEELAAATTANAERIFNI